MLAGNSVRAWGFVVVALLLAASTGADAQDGAKPPQERNQKAADADDDIEEHVPAKKKAKRRQAEASPWLSAAVVGGVSLSVGIGFFLLLGRKGAEPKPQRRLSDPAPDDAATHPTATASRRPALPPPLPDDDLVEPALVSTPTAIQAELPPSAFPREEPRESPRRRAESVPTSRHGPVVEPLFFHARDCTKPDDPRIRRVYVLPEELLVIDLGPEKVKYGNRFGANLGMLLGGVIGSAIGQLVQSSLAPRHADWIEAKRRRLDQTPIREVLKLVGREPHHYGIEIDRVLLARLDPPTAANSLLRSDQQHAGRFYLRKRGKGELHLELLTLDDMHHALESLPAALGTLLASNVVFDPVTLRFARKP